MKKILYILICSTYSIFFSCTIKFIIQEILTRLKTDAKNFQELLDSKKKQDLMDNTHIPEESISQLSDIKTEEHIFSIFDYSNELIIATAIIAAIIFVLFSPYSPLAQSKEVSSNSSNSSNSSISETADTVPKDYVPLENYLGLDRLKYSQPEKATEIIEITIEIAKDTIPAQENVPELGAPATCSENIDRESYDKFISFVSDMIDSCK